MENKNPMISSSIVSEQTMDDSPEESTWTFYMQDFQYGNNNNDGVDSFSDHHQESAGDDDDDDLVVSDAFSSSSGRKLLQAGDRDNSVVVAAAAFTSARCINGRQLSFKRRKPNIDDDHDLQDTASSPAHSPKVSYINQVLNSNQMDKDNMNIVPEGKNNGRENTTTADQQAVSIDIDEDDKNKQQSELNKRGLCLVPVSMLRNHFI